MNGQFYLLSEFLHGLAIKKGVTEKDVDPLELKAGIDVEKEHTDDENVARTIALDHLAEIPDYYTRLRKLEDQAKSQEPKL
jgi:hypothetical protein